jgi:RimJ/RimL family protein N-acetyltransferase
LTRLPRGATRQHHRVALPIFTERLAMRAYEAGDLARLHKVLYGDPEAMALLGGARDLAGTRASIERSMLQQELGGHSFWPVFERESGLLVGEAGLFPLAPGGPDIALGYAFGRDYWGRGYATEAARAVIERGFEAGVPEVYAVVRPRNEASIAVCRRLGMAPLGRLRRWYDVELEAFRLMAPVVVE